MAAVRNIFKVGTRIEDTFSADMYEIVAVLGRGGFGQVYRAELLSRTGRRRPRGRGTVCLKVTIKP